MSSRRNKGGGGGHDGGGEERWLLPYADMITLLLGLFIVLFAMSSIDAKQFDHVKRSLSETFNGAVLTESGGTLDGANGIMDPNASTAAPTSTAVQLNEAARRTGAKFDREQKELEALAKELGAGNDVQVVSNQRGILINLAGDAVFDSGSWIIKPEFRDDLTRIERELKAFGHPIEIVGHTDGVPYEGEFGNLGLSSNRANAVNMFFRSLGYRPSLITSVGRGDLDPKVKPQSRTKGIAANRRIEIIVLKPGANTPDDGTELVARQAERAAKMSPDAIAKPAATKTPRQELAEDVTSPIIAELAKTSKAAG